MRSRPSSADKPEQIPAALDPGAWLQPGCHPVAPGLWRIPLSLPLTGLSAVNAYLFIDGDEALLVDPGWAGTPTREQLITALNSLGLGLPDISRIVATHAHWDHFSQAVQLRAELGVPIALGEGERASLEAYPGQGSFYPAQVRELRLAGAAALADAVAGIEQEPHERDVRVESPDEWLLPGDAITVGSRTVLSIATPGHTRGHVALADDSAGVLLTGDHVLPRITPSFGFEYRPERLPLRSFLRSLELVRDRADAQLLPAHGNVTASVRLRAVELIGHHAQRFAEVVAHVSAGATTAHEVACGMRWTRARHELGELAPLHQMFAVLEVLAHLEVLSEEGRVQREERDGVLGFF